MLVLILFGCLCGFIANILGVGSSLMMVPLLLYVYPLLTGLTLDMQTILSATLALTFFSTTVGSVRYHQFGLIPYRYALMFAASGALGSFVGGSLISQYVNHLAILILFGIMAILSFIFNLIPRRELPEQPPDQKHMVIGLFIVFVLGVLTGIIGIGGMVIFMPYMLIVLRFPIRKTIGATTFIGTIIALFGMLGKAFAGDMNWSVGLIIALGGLIGGYIGPSFARYLPEKALTWGMNIILFFIIITVFIDITNIILS